MKFTQALEYLNFNRVFIHIAWETIPNVDIYSNKEIEIANKAHRLQDTILNFFGIKT